MINHRFTIFAASVMLALASLAAADVPFVFSAGSPARASEVNDNFANLDQRSSNLEFELDNIRRDLDALKQWRATTISCIDDNQALITAVAEGYEAITISGGDCDANLTVRTANLSIVGQGLTRLYTDPANDGSMLSSISGSKMFLTNVTVEGALSSETTGFLALKNVVVNCSEKYAALMVRPSSSVYLNNVNMGGCHSVYAELGNIYAVGNVTFRPATNKLAILLQSSSSFFSTSNSNLAIFLANATADTTRSRTISVWNSSTLHLTGTSVIQGDIIAYANSHLSLGEFEWGNKSEASESLVARNNSSVEALSSTFSNKLITIGVNSSGRIFGDAQGEDNKFYISENSSLYVDDVFSHESVYYEAQLNSTILNQTGFEDAQQINSEWHAGRNSIIKIENENATFSGTCSVDTHAYLLLNDESIACE